MHKCELNLESQVNSKIIVAIIDACQTVSFTIPLSRPWGRCATKPQQNDHCVYVFFSFTLMERHASPFPLNIEKWSTPALKIVTVVLKFRINDAVINYFFLNLLKSTSNRFYQAIFNQAKFIKFVLMPNKISLKRKKLISIKLQKKL